MAGNFGQGSIGFTGKSVSGAPFVAGAANNGLSVDPVSGKIVLGNNPGQAGNPAEIFTDREILLSAFIQFVQAAGGVYFVIDPVNLIVSLGFDGIGNNVRIALDDNANRMQLSSANLLINALNIEFSGFLPGRTSASSVVVQNNAGNNPLQRIQGASGTFTTVDLKTVTVLDGVITAIV